jgi:GNAT superfamily N-acetyltransferase
MINYATANTNEDLIGILDLQKTNLRNVLTKQEMESQGFLTVIHHFNDLRKLNDIENHVVAKEGEKVIAYLLAMTKESKFEIPALIPMFETFDQTYFNGKYISDYNYIIVGQVCVDKQYRGQGIIDKCYDQYKNQFGGKYDFAITEIASTNIRSLTAHKRIGFKEISRHNPADVSEWCIVAWDWKNSS